MGIVRNRKKQEQTHNEQIYIARPIQLEEKYAIAKCTLNHVVILNMEGMKGADKKAMQEFLEGVAFAEGIDVEVLSENVWLLS